MALPDKKKRPRVYDFTSDRYQWRLGRAPAKIRKSGKDIDNPFLDTAVFVVHGMGEQKDTETAAAMRWGIEDSLPLVQPDHDNAASDEWILPAPYLYDGHWAEYDSLATFEKDIRGDLEVLTERQKTFFTKSWEARTRGWFRTWIWVIAQGLKLIL